MPSTCLAKGEVVFRIVHSQDRVVVGSRHSRLRWGALVQGAVLGFPASIRERQEGGLWLDEGLEVGPLEAEPGWKAE